MHPTGVATAAWVLAAAPSKTPFYIAGGVLAGWAVLLGAFGVTHPEFPGSAVRSRLVMLTSAVLVAAAITTAVTTSGTEGPEAAASATGSTALNLSADPTGKLAFDKKQATVRAGHVAVRFVNKSSLPHNVTIAKGGRTVAHTNTVTGATATATANLAAGDYVFYCSVDGHRAGGMQGTLTVK